MIRISNVVKNTIPLSNEIKVLGVTIDNKLKFDAHIVSVCRQMPVVFYHSVIHGLAFFIR